MRRSIEGGVYQRAAFIRGNTVSDVHNRVVQNTKCDLVIPRMRTAFGQNAFAFCGVDTWHKLHSDIKLAPSIQSFKAKLKAHN